MYVMQIKIYDATEGKKVWKSIKASHATEPYKYADRNEAERQLNSCYPDMCKDDARVIEEENAGR